MGPLGKGLSDYRAPFDTAIFHFFNGLPQPAPWLSQLVGHRVFGVVAIAVGFIAILQRHRRRALQPLVIAAVSLGATDLLGSRLLKPLFHRLRPCYALPPDSFHHWLNVANAGSLPSIHAANAFALAFSVSRTVPRTARWVYPVATFIALSRVIAGVHWPSDIVAGALFGTLVAALVERLPKLQPGQISHGGGHAPASASRQ